MYFPKTAALAALISSTAFSAHAFDLGNGLILTGDVELEFVSGDDVETDELAFADITLSWRNPSNGPFGFGADFTVVANDQPGENSDKAVFFWGGPVLTTPYGEFTVGRPRPVISKLIEVPRVGGLRLLDPAVDELSNSAVEAFASDEAGGILGLTFIGTAGNLTYGVGLHDLDGFDLQVLEAALLYRLGDTTLRAGFEDFKGQDISKIILGAEHDFGRFSLGAQLSRVTSGSEESDVTQIYGSFAVTERIELGVQLLRLDQGSFVQNLQGVTAEYQFDNGAFAELGVLQFDQGGGGDDSVITNLSVGFRF